jgi:peptidyl-prolyl cis-trans isomerase SurA
MYSQISASLALAMLMASASTLHAQTIAMTVYGEAITEDDIEQRTKLNLLASRKFTRQEVIEQLAADKDNVRKAQRFTAAQIDEAYGQMCSRIHVTPDLLAQSLEAHRIRVGTLRAFIEARMARASLRRLRY